jgi:shikimate dehydrogenase
MKKTEELRLYGIFGYPLSHTLSPAMQEAGFEACGWKVHYLVFELELPAFRETLKGLPNFLLDGFNVTVPYKEQIIPFLDVLTPKARAIGAVNTVYRQGRKWAGTNTDVDGFLRSLMMDGGFRPRGCKVLLLGAGGAARAVLYGLASEGAKSIIVTDLMKEKAETLIRHFQPLFPRTVFATIPCLENELEESLQTADLVVNATTVGLKASDPVLLKPAWIPKAKTGRRMFFYDLIYQPSRTAFLKNAAAKGHKISNGLGMLLYQGAAGFEHWSGRKAPVEVMRRALMTALKEREKNQH